MSTRYRAYDSSTPVTATWLNQVDDMLVGSGTGFSVTKYGAVMDGVTDSQTALVTAVAAAKAAGADLYWPAGTAVSTANIPDFHNVRHWGPGAIKRGSNTFKVAEAGGTNQLYASPSGLSTNDGLTAAVPFSTVQLAVNAWARYAELTANTFTINLTGTFSEGAVADGIKSTEELTINGGNKATTIIDGTSSALVFGLNFNNCNSIRIKNLTVRNWPGVGSGIIFQNGTRGVIDTCDGTNNAEANFNCSEDGEMVVIGSCSTTGGKFGMRYYRNSGGSVGDGTNPISITTATQAGIVARDGSKVVTNNNFTVTNCNSTNTTAGVLAQKDGYIELRTCTITGNYLGVVAENLSIVDTQTGTRTVTGNTQNYRISQCSVDRSFFSPSADVMQTWIPRSTPSALTASANYDLVLNTVAATGLQVLTDANTFNLDVNKTERLAFDASASHRLTLVLNSANAYRWTSANYIPLVDNTSDLGATGGFRWKQAFAVSIRPGDGTPIWTSGSGTPEGVVTAVVGSLYTRTNGGAGTTLYIKESGSGNTGWVAK